MGDGDRTIRWWALAVSLAAVFAVASVTGSVLSTRGTPAAMIVAHGTLFIAGLAVWLSAMQAPPSPRMALVILVAALVARALLLPFPVSDDFNRYIWEGRLVLAGESPYAQPAAVAAEHWRDAVWAGMNHRDKLTAYPPLAQLVFAVGVAIDYAVWPLKLIFVAAEMLTLCLLLGELRRRRLPKANLALAAFSPVLLLATAGEAHFDSLFVLATLLALRATDRRRDRLAWMWIGVAIQLKLVAVLLLPILFRRGGWWRSAWPLPLVVAMPALPFAFDLPNLLQGILAFGTAGSHNGFVPDILRPLIGDAAATAAISYGLLAVWSTVVAVRVDDPFRAGFLVFAGLLLLSPITHLWYFSWIVPFLVLMPQPAWLLLTGLQAVYFITWVEAAAGRGWYQPEWAWWVQWLPFAALLCATSTGAIRRLFSFRQPPTAWPSPADISVVMPVYNEGQRVAAAVRQLLRDQTGVREVIVVDGGSSDRTRAYAEEAGARAISAARGRGHQITAGIAEARGAVIWIVHADVTPAPGTAEAILGALRADPAAAGGAVGQCYARVSALLLAIEGLNAARSALFGLSFGDQGQFFRRAALPALGGFPDQPLMEDVELSLRLRRAGPVLHLGTNGVVSTRRWDRDPALHRIGMVIRLTAAYLVSTNRSELSRGLYRAYYPMNEK
jgi:Glycosyltransferases involved in cell wall biogenesis